MFLPKKHADLPIEPSVLESLRAQEKSLKREKKKAAKERRQHAKQLKKAEKHAKKRITARKVPQRASDCLQYLSMSQDGICEVEPGLFSMTMAFTDVNFQIAMLEEQKNIFTKYSEFLNYFDPSLHLEINLVTRSMDEEKFRREVMSARLLEVGGVIQKSPEGVIHLMADHVADRTFDLERLSQDEVLEPAGEGGLPGPARSPTARHPRDVRVLPKSRDFH